MANNRLRILLSRVVDIKPGEEMISVLLFLYFFFIQAPYYVIKAQRNASYLEKVDVIYLPLVYFLVALLMGFVVNFHSRLQIKLSRYRLLISSLSFFFVNICLFWWLLGREWKWVPVAFWIWANIFAIVLVTQFWILVNDVFNPREAKRLIGFIGSGGLLGSIFGSLITGYLAKTSMGKHLLLIAAGMLFLGILIAYSIFALRGKRQPDEETEASAKKEKEGKPAKVGFRDAFSTVKQSTYLKLLAGIVTTTWVVSTLVDFQFNSVVDVKVQGGANLKAFFGFFNAGTMAFAFLFQLFMTSRIIRNLGIRLTLLVYPLIMLFCSGGIGALAFASIVPAILIKAGDKSLAYSLNQSVRELLYIPISPEQKYKAKIFIDMFVNRFAKGLAAIILVPIILLASREKVILPIGLRAISLVVIGLIGIWILINLRVSGEYTNTVKDKIKQKWERGDWLVSQKLDVDYTKLVFDTIESKDRSSVLYAMHLFDLIRQDKLTPEVKKLISYKSDEIRAASLGTLIEQGETGLGPRTEEELSEDVLKKEIQEIMELDVYQEVMKDYLQKTLEDRSAGSEIARMEAAKAIGLMDPHAPSAEKLDELLEDESAEVSRYAVLSAASLKRREDVPALIKKLHNVILREDTVAALQKYGEKITGALADYLHDKTENLEVRKAIASVLAGIGTQEAAELLSWELDAAAGELKDEIVDALDRIRTGNPGVRFSADVIKPRIIADVKLCCQNLVRHYDEEGQRGGSEIGRECEQRLSRSVWIIFKLLGLVYPHQDMAKAFQNLKAGTKDSVAYALELLDNVLEREIRDIVFPLVEDLPLEEKVKRCRSLLGNSSAGKNGLDHG